jgi:hypothetical protein
MNPIEKYRVENGLSYQKLADLVGLDVHTVFRHTRGEGMTVRSMLQYKSKLGIDPAEHLMDEVLSR